MNALTYIFLSRGIPIVYYGTEATFNGGDDPLNREVFNPFSTPKNDLIMNTLKVLNKVRKEQRTYDYELKFSLVDFSTLAFTKGDKVLVIVTNSENAYEIKFM